MLSYVLVTLWFCSLACSLAPHARMQSTDIITGGFATFLFQHGVPGACGIVHQDTDFIGAIAIQRYGNAAMPSPLCGQAVHITNTNNNKSVTIKIADACPICVNSNSFDLSVGAFEAISTFEDGLVPITWSFV